jgi:hypothetical protein
MSPEFRAQIDGFRQDWYARAKDISETRTPQVDGGGRLIILKKGQYDAVSIAYMKDRLNYYFPGWSWESPPSALQVLGIEWVTTSGVLCIIDPFLIQWGVIPPIRRYYSTDAKRITHRATPRKEKDKVTGKLVDIIPPHSADTIVDLSNDVKIVNTNCLKKAIQMLTGIGDDVYKYTIEEDGMGSHLEVFQQSPTWDNLVAVLPGIGLDTVSMLRLLGCKNAAELDRKYGENYMAVYQAVLTSKGGQMRAE